MSRILIVDDEPSICWSFREFLSDDGHDVAVAASAEEGLSIATAEPIDALVLDVRLPGIDGLTAMHEFRGRIGPAPIVVITAFGNLDTAVRALQAGAFEYLVKPFDLDHAAAVLRRALDSDPAHKLAVPRTPLTASESLIGNAPAMQGLFKQIALAASADVPVLITGESGTGKELVARAIHRHGARSDRGFLPISLPALSPSLFEAELFGHARGAFTGATQDRRGLLEQANGGTVLLDEIGDTPLELQVKLLRAIENREVLPVGSAQARPIDVRVLAATHRRLEDLMAAGAFREDLYFRLNVFRVEVPPLRDRIEDIPLLVAHFLDAACSPNQPAGGLTEAALDELRNRRWPGNIRELRNVIEHASVVVRGQVIRPEHLPPAAASSPSTRLVDRIRADIREWTANELRESAQSPDEPGIYERSLDVTEPAVLAAVLEHCRGNRATAAQLLGIHRATLRQRLRKHAVNDRDEA